MTKCPGCQATLPDGSTRCQFCGADWSAPPSVRAPARARGAAPSGAARPVAGWIWPAYYLVAAYWLASGVWLVLRGTVLASAEDQGGMGILGLLVGAFSAIVGLGLIARVEAARGIVNVLCFVNILFGSLDILGLFLGGLHFSLFELIGFLLAILQVGLSVLMIFLIGETESSGPRW